MALKRPLLGEMPTAEGSLRCWYWSGEDELEEIERRIAAICDHHGLDGREIEGRLFCDSSQEMPLKIATMRRGGNVEFNERDIKQITEGILDRKIDVFVADPLISIHSVPEGDNMAMDQVVKKFAAIAGATNCAIDIDHHTRKLAIGQTEVTADDARGAGAIIGAVRASRVINRMTQQQAKDIGLSDLERESYFRVGRAKANRTPPENAKWSRVVSKILANGDNVGALEAWQYPDAFANVTTTDMYAIRDLTAKDDFRADSRAKNWIGKAIAERLNLNLANEADRAQIKRIFKTWIGNGVLAIDEREDKHRKMREYIVPGRLKDGSTPITNGDDNE